MNTQETKEQKKKTCKGMRKGREEEKVPTHQSELTALTLSAASRKSPSEEAVDLAKFASCVAVIGSPMVGSAALELATSFDVGYKNAYKLHLLRSLKKKKNLHNFVQIRSIDRLSHKHL